MAFLKKEVETGESEGGVNYHSCVDDDCQGKALDAPVRGTFNIKSEVPVGPDGYNNASSTEVKEESFEVADTHIIKEEHNPAASIESNNDMENSTHSDHNYTGEGRQVKQEYLQGVLPNSHIYANSGHIMKQEIKVCPQNCAAPVKAEALSAKPANNVYVKTETVDNSRNNAVVGESSTSNVSYQCAQTHKCTKCNTSFVNEKVFKTHIARCSFNGDSIVVPFVKSKPTAKTHRCNQCDYSSQTTKKLIASVRKHPCLYRTDHEDCKKTQIKTVIWSSIASDCNLPNGPAAKAEWQKLRQNFIDAVRRQNFQNNYSRKQKKWRYFQQMEFILPYITSRPSNSNVRDDHNNGEASNQTVQASAVPEINDVDEDAEEDCPIVQSAPPAKKAKISPPQVTPQRNRDRPEPATQTRAGARPSTSSQPLDMFFLSMCETTKNLPPYVQLQVKKKIFQAVIEAEEIVAAMNNDQEKNGMFQSSSSEQDEYPNNMSPFSVQSAGVEDSMSWQDE